MRESDLDREYRLCVEDPYVWISPFAAYARVQYELEKLEKDIDRKEDELSRTWEGNHAVRGLLKEQIRDLGVAEHATKAILQKF
jgi:hypothetical protein